MAEKETYVFKPKMRVSTMNEDGTLVSDRLVDSYPELMNGPRFQHKGPVRLEITLTSTQDIERFKTYIDQLVGNLPIKEPSQSRGRPSTGGTKLLESPREDILTEVEKMVQEGNNQDEIIRYLRSLGFIFILTEDLLYYFENFPFNTKDIGEPTNKGQYPNSFSWMIRCLKKAKDPKADKFDPQIIFGFSIQQGPSKKVIPYLYKERKQPLRVTLGKKALTFSKVEFTKMPAWMLPEERLKFSAEQRALLANPDKKPSSFFIRWYQDVEFPNSIKDKIYEIVKR